MRLSRNRLVAGLAATALVFVGAGCSADKDSKKPEDTKKTEAQETDKKTDEAKAEPKAISVFATTGYLADAVKNIAPNAKVFTMVKPGGDPHTYKPSTKDIEEMEKADAVIWNGLHLEALMIKQLKSFGDKQIAVGEKLSKDMLLPWPEKDDEGNELHDPHIWNSPANWKVVVTEIAKHLGKIDKDGADTYMKNADAYNKKIDEADEAAKKVLAELPDTNRMLVTGHDAFSYLGKNYNLQVEATDFVTSEAVKSAAELNELAELIAKNKVKTIFVDNLQNPQAVKSLQENVKSKGWDVKIADEELYADSLGESAPVDTYLGVLKHNTEAIAKGLK